MIIDNSRGFPNAWALRNMFQLVPVRDDQETYEEHPYLEEEEDLFCLCGQIPKDLMEHTDYDYEQYIPSGSLW